MQDIARRLRSCILLCALCSLVACSSGYAPVTDQSIGARRHSPLSPPSSYTVRRGDTLYAIAWRYGMDYRELAKINRINSANRIYPGQKLTFRPKYNVSKSSQKNSSSRPSSSTASTSSSKTQRISSVNSNKSANSSVLSNSDSSKQEKTAISSTKVAWNWPASGVVIGRYSTSGTLNKGIDIKGENGDPVKAAAAGYVVYAGSGLLGYGNLVIINHNQKYLSAYAHNSRIFVKENDKVASGQKIAEIGSTGTNRPKLHFEIRRDGKPVDPLQYLPKK